MGKSRLTEAEIAEMASRYLAGETSTVLGAYYGVHAATVYDLLRTRGVCDAFAFDSEASLRDTRRCLSVHWR